MRPFSPTATPPYRNSKYGIQWHLFPPTTYMNRPVMPWRTTKALKLEQSELIVILDEIQLP